jgi:protein TonB
MTLIKYVPPVYPSIARGSNNEGWLDVNFQVMPDGSVINPSIGNGTASRIFHRAAMNAVSQWKFSPAPTGVTEQRPMHVRLEFKLTN